MDYFDRLLSLDLARMLDPIVATRPPRRGRSRSRPRLKIWINPDPDGAGVAGPNDMTMQAVSVVVEPVVPAASSTTAYS